MYRHFLVPIDHTEDSVDLVVRAVNLAASMKARVTFLHTERQRSRASDPAGPRVCLDDPRHPAPEVLAKAEAAARAWGVPCQAMTAGPDDSAAAAIATAARDQGCDVILVAAPGHHRHSDAPTSEVPPSVVPHFDLPVLITATTAVASSAPALRALREEHRLLATALQAWGQALDAGESFPVSRMQPLLAFIDRLEAEHHPKENKLFLSLRARTSTVDADLDEIGRQHDREAALLADLAHRLQAALAAPDAAAQRTARQALASAVAAYTRLIWDHLGREEAVVLPAAMRHLQDADWADLEQAYSQPDVQTRSLERKRLLNNILQHVQDPLPHMPGHDGGRHAT